MTAASFAEIGALTLGTVQLGIAYGVANTLGQPSEAAAAAVLDQAWTLGLRCLDTSRDYGVAEERIGAWMGTGGRRPALITKTPKIADDADAATWVATHVEVSCRMLGVERLEGLLLRSQDFLRPGVVPELRRLKEGGRLGAFGISAYEPDHLAAALEVPDMGVIQIPFNAFDGRFQAGGLLERCRRRNVAVFVRSAYLQGLLVMRPVDVPAAFAAARPAIAAFAELAEAHGLSPAELALAHVRDTPGVTSVVVGAETPEQVRSSAAAIGTPRLSTDLRDKIRALAASVPDWLPDPRYWPKR